MSGLDEKAVLAARAAFYGPKGSVVAAISAYLAAATPADVGEEPVAWRWKTPAEDDHWVWSYSAVIDNPHDARCEPLYSATALERVVRERDEARVMIGKLEDDLSEAAYEPWPEWASKVLAVIRKRSGYDGYDDATDGVDLPIELDEAMDELEAEADRQKLRATSAEAKLAGARKVIEPFAEASREFNFAMGPDGIDDGITVIASTVVRDREATLSTSDFSAARRWVEETVEAETIETYFARQIDWSRETFGSALRTGGVIDHIRKELKEIEADPHDLSEWIDVVILAMDGFWRHGGKASGLLPRLLAKQQKNMARTWPDWRSMSENQAIEHVRNLEPRHD